MLKPQIILLNGTSSAGKSSIARALQMRLRVPYLHVCIDTFEEMMPERYALGGEFSRRTVFKKMLSGFHHSIVALAQCGNNLIVDHVLIEGAEPQNWVTECLSWWLRSMFSLWGSIAAWKSWSAESRRARQAHRVGAMAIWAHAWRGCL